MAPRLLRLLSGAERLLADAQGLLTRAEATRVGVDEVVAEVGATALRVDSLVTLVEPSVVQLVPLLEQLPELRSSVQDDVLPTLGGMGTVADDLRALLDASLELNELLGNVPGMGRARRKVEEARSEDSHEEG